MKNKIIYFLELKLVYFYMQTGLEILMHLLLTGEMTDVTQCLTLVSIDFKQLYFFRSKSTVLR